jgi:hypothetical protein
MPVFKKSFQNFYEKIFINNSQPLQKLFFLIFKVYFLIDRIFILTLQQIYKIYNTKSRDINTFIGIFFFRLT